MPIIVMAVRGEIQSLAADDFIYRSKSGCSCIRSGSLGLYITQPTHRAILESGARENCTNDVPCARAGTFQVYQSAYTSLF